MQGDDTCILPPLISSWSYVDLATSVILTHNGLASASSVSHIPQEPERDSKNLQSLITTMTTLQDSVPIPQPPTWPFVGNLLDINNTAPIDGPLTLLGKAWGEIYRIDVGGNAIIVAGSQKIVNELCDQERFEKKLFPSTIELRKIVSDGEPDETIERIAVVQ